MRRLISLLVVAARRRQVHQLPGCGRHRRAGRNAGDQRRAGRQGWIHADDKGAEVATPGDLGYTIGTDTLCDSALGRPPSGGGQTWDDKALGDLAAGSYAMISTGMPHYVMAKGVTVVQVHGLGPFAVNYVNTADNPSKK